MLTIPFTECTDEQRQVAAEIASKEFRPEQDDGASYLRYFTTRFVEPDAVYVAVDDTKSTVYGVVAVKFSPPNGYIPHISDLVVAPERRNQGIASNMLLHVIDRLANQGWHAAYLWCTHELKPYYEKKGWKTMTELKKEELYVMMYEIAAADMAYDDDNSAYSCF